MIYDLSVKLSDKTATYPGDPQVRFVRTVHYADCGFNVGEITMGTHSGTHVDLSLHCISGGTDAADISIEKFCGDAVTVKASVSSDGIVSLSDIDTSQIRKGDILLISTGWEEKSGSLEFFSGFPSFNASAAQLMADCGIKAIGTDLPSVDAPGSGGEIHRMILGANIVIIEALVNLAPLIGKRVFFSAVPLKIIEGDGSPVRAYAIG